MILLIDIIAPFKTPYLCMAVREYSEQLGSKRHAPAVPRAYLIYF